MPRARRNDRRSPRDPERIAFARDQRKRANEFAQDVWQLLRAGRMRGCKFRREYPISPYTVDFVCLSLALIVEVDGAEHQTEEGQRRDARRDQFLHDQGYKVIRIDGHQVTQDRASVRKRIEAAVDEPVEQE